MGLSPAGERYCRCGTRLAADNSQRQCARCQRASRDRLIAPPAVPAEFWHLAQMQDEFAAQHIGHVGRAYRMHPYHQAVYGRGGISQGLLGQWLGMSQPQVSRIETGPPIRHLDTLRYWARTLRMPAELLWFDLPPGELTVALVAPTSAPHTSPVVPQATTGDEDEVYRRVVLHGVLTVAGMGLSTSALAMLEQVRRRMDAVLDSSNVSEHTVEYWQQMPHEYAQRYQVTPPRELLTDVVSDFAELQQLLTHRQPMRQRAELCRISGQLAVLIGIFLAALAKQREGRAWFRTAILAAREADDPQLAGLATMRAGIVSLYHDAPEAALAHSERARSLLGDALSPWLVRGLVVEARSLAQLHRQDAARARLDRAETLFGQLPASATADTALGYTERQFYFTVGNAYTLLGMTTEAEEFQCRALALYRPNEYLDPTLIQLDRATCMATTGEPDEACAHVSGTITAAPAEHRTGLVAHYAKRFLAQLPTPVQHSHHGRELRKLLKSC